MSDTHNMDYNSQQENLKISEYGRNIQNMINYAKTIEDKEKRQRIVEGIVHLMMQITPQSKNVADYKQKLWNHLLYIADYDLEVELPEGVVISEETVNIKPDPLTYPVNESRYRHYGSIVQLLIKKAVEMEDPEMKKEFTQVIAAYMKLAFRTWNHEANINDNVIKGDLKEISDGLLIMDPEEPINYLASSYVKPKRQPVNKGRSGGRGKKKSHNSNNNRKRRR